MSTKPHDEWGALSGHDAMGRPGTITHASSSYTYSHDGLVLPRVEGISVPSYSATLTRTVSTAHGRLTEELVADDGTSVTLGYTTRPEVASGGTLPFFEATAVRGGVTSSGTLRLKWLTPWITPNGTGFTNRMRAEAVSGSVQLNTDHGVNAWGELTRLGTTQGATTWFADEICARDDAGGILRRFESYWTGTANESLRYVYTYTAGRLSSTNAYRHTGTITCATTSGGTLVSAYSGIYGVVTNTLNRTFANGAYNAEDQLTAEGPTGSVRNYGWDGRGRLTSRTGGTPGYTYTWDSRNHMTSSANSTSGTTRTYQYDPTGRLVAARGGGLSDEYFVYRDGTEPVAWSSGPRHQYYVYGSQRHVPDLIYEDYDSDPDIEAVYRVVTDERGSVRMVIQINAIPNPIVVQRIEYDVFGNPTFVVGGETVQPFGYAGAIWLGHPRFWHMGARDYDPTVGRWTSKDPIRFAGGTNLYVYCEGDPLNHVDRTGRWTEQVGWFGGYAAVFGGWVSGGYYWGTRSDGGWEEGWYLTFSETFGVSFGGGHGPQATFCARGNTDDLPGTSTGIGGGSGSFAWEVTEADTADGRDPASIMVAYQFGGEIDMHSNQSAITFTFPRVELPPP